MGPGFNGPRFRWTRPETYSSAFEAPAPAIVRGCTCRVRVDKRLDNRRDAGERMLHRADRGAQNAKNEPQQFLGNGTPQNPTRVTVKRFFSPRRCQEALLKVTVSVSVFSRCLYILPLCLSCSVSLLSSVSPSVSLHFRFYFLCWSLLGGHTSSVVACSLRQSGAQHVMLRTLMVVEQVQQCNSAW